MRNRANTASMRWITLTRLRRTTALRSLENYHLGFARQMHAEAPLRNRHNHRPRRPVAYLLAKLHTLTLESRFFPPELRELDTLAMPEASPGDHRRRYHHECDQAAGDYPAAALQSSLRHARSLALRARELRWI